MSGRPSVSVIVPFAGSAMELELVVSNLSSLARRSGDELIVADNRDLAGASSAGDAGPSAGPVGPSAGAAAKGEVRIVRARGVRAPGFARNLAARSATAEWLVFIDSDTLPPPSLLDRYFDPAPGATTAVLAGEVIDVAARSTVVARHSVARNQMSQRWTLNRRGTPYAQTANCAVLRSAFLAVGGFNGQIRSGEDADLCIRLQRAGWELEQRPAAAVEHRSRDSLRALVRQLARHGSGAAWLDHAYPGEFSAPGARELTARLAHSARDAARALARGDRERSAFALLDLAETAAFELGRRLPNRARDTAEPHPH